MAPPPQAKTGAHGTGQADAPPPLSARYTKAEAYAKANPYEYEKIIARFQNVTREAPRGSNEAHLARSKVKAAQKEWHHLQYTVMPPLLQKTNALAVKGEYDEAIKLLEEYEGEYKNQTAALREKKIMEYRTAKKERAEIEKRESAGPLDGPQAGGDAPPEGQNRKEKEATKN